MDRYPNLCNYGRYPTIPTGILSQYSVAFQSGGKIGPIGPTGPPSGITGKLGITGMPQIGNIGILGNVGNVGITGNLVNGPVGLQGIASQIVGNIGPIVIGGIGNIGKIGNYDSRRSGNIGIAGNIGITGNVGNVGITGNTGVSPIGPVVDGKVGEIGNRGITGNKGKTGQIPTGSVTGTTNQVNVINSRGTYVFSSPQDIHTGALPTFSNTSILTVNPQINILKSNTLNFGTIKFYNEEKGPTFNSQTAEIFQGDFNNLNFGVLTNTVRKDQIIIRGQGDYIEIGGSLSQVYSDDWSLLSELNGFSIQSTYSQTREFYAYEGIGPQTFQPIDGVAGSEFYGSITPYSSNSNIMIDCRLQIGCGYSGATAGGGSGGITAPEAEYAGTRWWGIQLYRKIGAGSWDFLTGAHNETNPGGGVFGTKVFITDNWSGNPDNPPDSERKVANIRGIYIDNPNTTSEVRYTLYWNPRMGNNPDDHWEGSLYLNRSQRSDDLYRPLTTSSIQLQELYKH